jgi:sugar lactone lactonase YvrE
MRPLLVLTLLVAACAGGGETTPVPVLALLAGDMTSAGAVDGTGAAARFNALFGIATDSAGNVYASDRGNNTIRKITPAGSVTTLAGKAGVTGSLDGSGTAASFDYPNGIATDNAGNVYVADYGNCTIRKITSAGVVTTLAGKAGAKGSIDGTGQAARFEGPLAIAADTAGNLYVADLRNTIRKITSAGVVTTLAGKAFAEGSADGSGAAARFNFLRGIAIDSAGHVYVADHDNHTIRKITPEGVVTTLAGKAGVEGSADGPAAAARFAFPLGIAVDSAGNIYAVDSLKHTIRKITPAGMVSTVVRATNSVSGRMESLLGVAVSETSLFITFNNGFDGKTAAGGVAVVRNRP